MKFNEDGNRGIINQKNIHENIPKNGVKPSSRLNKVHKPIILNINIIFTEKLIQTQM